MTEFSVGTIMEGSIVPIFSNSTPDLNKLRDLLDKDDIRDLPVFVLAVAGEIRTGKSFLLSYFLRYLKYQNCMDGLGDENEPLTGFDHKCNIGPVTQGIKIWDQPLVVTRKTENGSEEKILVLLLDSQGILYPKDAEESKAVFSLTTMLSSVLVFNLKNQLNEIVMENLELFTAYAGMAFLEDKDKTPFQKMMILIRDWGMPDKMPFGSEGGKKYLKEHFQDQEVVMHKTFRDIECYLMPNPGECVEKDTYNGCLKGMRPIFREQLLDLTKQLLNPQHVEKNLKKFNGETIKAYQFCDYFEKCTNLMKNENWKRPLTMLKMHASFDCELAKSEAIADYRAYMDNGLQGTELITEEQLQSFDHKAKSEAKNKYEVKSNFACRNDEESYKEYKKKLDEDLDKEFDKSKKRWETDRERQVKANMAENGYDLIDHLGIGGFGTVWHVKKRNTDKDYVIKVVTKTEELPAEEQKEVKIVRSLNHPNVIGYQDSFLNYLGLHIVLDYCGGGDLKKYIQACKGYIPEIDILKWSIQLSSGLEHMHGKKVLHRDIKPSNLLLSANKEVLIICDIGLAKQLDCTSELARTTAGTPLYIAPEILLTPGNPYTNKVDVWSAGCVIQELTTRKPTFFADNPDTMIKNIKGGEYSPIPQQYSTKLRKIIAGMLQVKQNARSSMSDIKKEVEELYKQQNQKKMNEALVWAARLGRTEKVDQLLKDGADINYQDWLGRCALYRAAHNGSVEMTARLLQQPGVHLHLKDHYRRTPLARARYWSTNSDSEDERRRYSQVAEQLVDAGATE